MSTKSVFFLKFPFFWAAVRHPLPLWLSPWCNLYFVYRNERILEKYKDVHIHFSPLLVTERFDIGGCEEQHVVSAVCASEWLRVCASEWESMRVSVWVSDWECVRVRERVRVIVWVSERESEWISERVSEWVSEWVNNYLSKKIRQ